jgi:hypothetical protein
VVEGNSRGTIHGHHTLFWMAESLTAPYGGTLLQRQARLHRYGSDERWRSMLCMWESGLAGEGELAEQAGKRKLHFG